MFLANKHFCFQISLMNCEKKIEITCWRIAKATSKNSSKSIIMIPAIGHNTNVFTTILGTSEDPVFLVITQIGQVLTFLQVFHWIVVLKVFIDFSFFIKENPKHQAGLPTQKISVSQATLFFITCVKAQLIFWIEISNKMHLEDLFGTRKCQDFVSVNS